MAFNLNLFGGGEKKEEKPKKPALALAPAAITPTPAMEKKEEGSPEVDEIKKEVERLKDSMNALRGSMKSLTEKLEEIEKNLGQLASIYELVTNQLNPFLDEEEKAATTPAPAPEPASSPAPVERVVYVEKGEEERKPVLLPALDLTNTKVIQTILDWMQFLVERVGHEGIDEILQYYVDIGWISEDVAAVLKRYADGIRVENEPEIEPPVQLDPEDHLKCLDYILQIKEAMQ